MENPARPLSLTEKVELTAWVVFYMPILVIISIARVVFTAWRRNLPLRPYVSCGFYRAVLRLKPEYMQALVPGTVETYRQWIKDAARNKDTSSLKLEEKIERLSPTSCIMWLGNPRTASKVVYFLHGGGYKGPLAPGHLEWCLHAYIRANSDIEVAVALLQYTLLPAPYPTQLTQAAAGLAHLLKSGIQPENIIIGGDSAGGNLTTQLLGHLLHPYPNIAPIELSRPLLGAFTVSPWVTSRMDDASFQQNKEIDMLSLNIHGPVTIATLADPRFEIEKHQGKGWAMPLDADELWLDGLGLVIRELYVTAGQNELFRDQIVRFADIVRRRSPDVNLCLDVVADEAHDFILLEGQMGVVGGATRRMREWAASVFC